MTPDYRREAALQGLGHAIIAGVDEVGRGPLAGPVTAAAVILNPDDIPEGLNDSKKLSKKKREALSIEIHARARIAIAHASVDEIERLNILGAADYAMCQAVAQLAPDAALVDGKRLPPHLPCPGQAVVRGDAKSLSIAAASIIAKVERDRLMAALAQQHPEYGWDHNAGYPTAEHKKALLKFGVTPHHRRSFAPVRNILWQEKISTR